MKKQNSILPVRIYLPLTLALILSLISCDKINSNEEDNKDVKTFTGVIRLTENENYCSQGFDNYNLYSVTDSSETRMIVMRASGDYRTVCLPNTVKHNEMPVIFTGVLQPIPPNVRWGGIPIVLYSIKSL